MSCRPQVAGNRNLSKKLHDEILPKVQKLKPRNWKKNLILTISSKDKNEDKNPRLVRKCFKDSEEIFKTMESWRKLQMEGADVYMSAFANLKHFDFFKGFQNWFVPFYPDHEIVNEISGWILGQGTNELAEALYKTPFICNSDKFFRSFLIWSICHRPENHDAQSIRWNLRASSRKKKLSINWSLTGVSGQT